MEEQNYSQKKACTIKRPYKFVFLLCFFEVFAVKNCVEVVGREEEDDEFARGRRGKEEEEE